MGVYGLLKGRNYQCVDMAFSLIVELPELAIGIVRDSATTLAHRNYSELELELTDNWDGEVTNPGYLPKMS